jgi:hypothetical protein
MPSLAASPRAEVYGIVSLCVGWLFHVRQLLWRTDIFERMKERKETMKETNE